MRSSASVSSAARAFCASLEIPTLRAPSVDAFLAARRAHPESPLLVTGALDAWALRGWGPEKLRSLDVEVPLEMSRGGADYRDAFRDDLSGGKTHAHRELGARAFVAGHLSSLRGFVDTFLAPDAKTYDTVAYLAQHDLLAQCRALAAAAPWRATFGDVVRAGPRARAGLEPVVSAWVAPRGVSTPLHFDRHPNLLVHLVGAKRVRLWPPGAGLPRHAAPADNTSPLDARDVPGALAADLAPGDVLFVPEGWWHFVETPRTSISISIWY